MLLRLPLPDTYLPNTSLEHIQGFFSACETLGSYTDHGLSLIFDELSSAGTPQAALNSYYQGSCPSAVLDISVEQEPGGLLHIAERFLAYTFQFAGAGYFSSSALTLSQQRDALGQALLNQLVSLFRRQPVTVFNIKVEGSWEKKRGSISVIYRDLVQEEFLLESAEARYYLSLGFND